MPLIMHGDQEFNLSHEEEEKLNQFQAITNFPDDDLPSVIKLLQMHGWHLERALSSFFDNNWKETLTAEAAQPPIPERPATGTPIPARSMTQQLHDNSPFTISEMNLVPSLPFIKPLPTNYRESYSVVGLNKSRHDIWDSSQRGGPLLMVLMFLPKLLGRVGFGLISILWGIITFGLRSNTSNRAKVSSLPSTPDDKAIPLNEVLPQITEEKAFNRLQALISVKRTFNECLKRCEEEFKFLLIILTGNVIETQSQDYDRNSHLLFSKIITSETVLSMLEAHKDDMIIYMGSVHELEAWLVAKQLHLKYTPECLLVGNVLNSNGSINGVTRLSLLAKLRVTSAKKFYNSLKLTIERFNPELLVSRAEKEELRVAREIRKRQDDAYEESLRQERIKEEKRKVKMQEELKEKAMREELERNRKWKDTAKQLFWLNACINHIKATEQRKTSSDETGILQVRTSAGCRLVKKFESDTTLYDLYVTIGSYLYLNETSLKIEEWRQKILQKIRELSIDPSILCFDDTEGLSDGAEMEEISSMIENETGHIPENISKLAASSFDFVLVSPFPRHNIPVDSETTIREVTQLWPKGSLLVEDIIESDSGEDTEEA